MIKKFSSLIPFVILSGLLLCDMQSLPSAEPVPVDLSQIAADVIINEDSKTYDSHPSAVMVPDGSTWVAWNAFKNSRDQILLRKIEANGTLGPIQTVSKQGAVHGHPTVVSMDGDTLWVVWSAKRPMGWTILAREYQAGIGQKVIIVSETEVDTIQPTATRIADDQLMIAWSGRQNGRFQIQGRVLKGKDWQKPFTISTDTVDAFRPAIAVDESANVWVVWDQYRYKRYNVVGRKVAPEIGPMETISPAERHGLQPTILSTKQGLFVAWLQKQDVIGGPGVISQWHTLHVAKRGPQGWKQIQDAEGNRVAAELTQGLMAQIEPKPVATSGYLGRRTAPMLLADGDDVWLLWERKSDHRGSTAKPRGDLVGRRIQQNILQPAAVLYQGKVDYHLAHPEQAIDNKFALLASNVFGGGRRVYHRLVGDLKKQTKFEQEQWAGWQPIELPIKREVTTRRTIQADGKTLKLFWADMHCHNNLSSDAEGEPDELNVYARDRAALDVVVFTNNDFYIVPLTQYEYELGNFFANAFTQEQKFLSLPGYEWTSRIPGVKTAKAADPGNWTHPYKNRSYPNHRSVVYPSDGGPVVRFIEVENDISQLNIAVQKTGGITLTQHPAFKPSGHPVEVGMELTSGWSNYIARVPKLFHGVLNRGGNLAFVACGDSHRRAPGLSGALTGIYAEELTAESILDALKKRRCFATNGAQFFVDTRANGALMGEEITAQDGTVNLSLQAIGTRPVVSATLIHNGKEIKTFKGTGTKEFSTELRLTGLPPGRHWFYWRIVQSKDAPVLPGNLMAAHGHLAWSTPHFVNVGLK
ncbi:CehA/McbA family metallohydrolase domain-containing protein [Gimesia aquarii]|uniref:Uncharacterized protein n=1 Tax=Gimesia aquarii TaxID=2527964 RepID=A0A517VTW4_9PLAN|nr:hypothetical protein [Gimesia aquarii]QDT96420.1 hypothetical protein V144x_18750 [Gimesia aquarii]